MTRLHFLSPLRPERESCHLNFDSSNGLPETGGPKVGERPGPPKESAGQRFSRVICSARGVRLAGVRPQIGKACR